MNTKSIIPVIVIAVVGLVFVIPDAEARAPKKTIGLAAADNTKNIRPRFRGGRNAPRFYHKGQRRHTAANGGNDSDKIIAHAVEPNRPKHRRHFRGGRAAGSR